MSSNYEKLKKLYSDDPEMLAMLERKETQALLRELAKDIDRKTAVEIAMELRKGDRGEPGHTPVKGKDYFTEEEIGRIAQWMKDTIKEEVRPIKGVDYFDGDKGDDADESEMIQRLKDLIPTVDEIAKKVPIPEFPAIDEAGMLSRFLNAVPKPKIVTVEDLVAEIKSKKLLELRDIRGARLDSPKSSGQYLHGGGLTTILNAGTLVTNNMTSLNFTGAGINSITVLNGVVTVDVSGGGGGGETLAQTLAIGNVTGGTDIEMSAGDFIVSPNGQTQVEVSDSGFIVTTDAGGFATPYFTVVPTQVELASLGGGGVLMTLGALSFAHNTLIQFSTAPVRFNAQTASRIAIFDGSKNLISADTATYPDLTELSYVKGVTSSIQTQLNGKQATITPAALTRVDDTNVTVTLGGTPATALLQAVSLTLGWTGQLSLARGGTGANLSDPGFDAVFVWDNTTNATRLAQLSGLSYDSGTNTLTASGTPISFGTTTQIPYMNAGGTDFIYSASLTFDGTTLSASALQIDNVNINGNTISSTAGTDLLITPLAGQQLILDGTIIIDAGVVEGITSLGVTGNRVTAGFFVDLTVTNTISGSITGTAAVATTVTVADETTDTTCFITFVTAATGNLGVKSNTNMTFNSNTGVATFASTVLTTTDINGGTIDGTVIGGASAAAGTFTTATAEGFVPTSTTATGNRMYLPAANTIGWAINGTGEMQLTSTALSPIADGGSSLGTTALGWQNLFGNTGFVFNLENGDWVATHTAGILTVGTGDLRVTNAGVNSASVVTNAGTQSLTNKSLTDPKIYTAINAQTNDYTLALTDASKLVDMNKATAVAVTVPANGSIAFPVGTSILIRMLGAGAVTITPDVGVTFQTSASPVTVTTQYNFASLIKVATDTWAVAIGSTGGGVPTTITVANEATDTTCFVAFFTAATGDLGPKTNTNMTFNSNTGVVTFASSVLTTTDINGGTIDGAVIGGASAAAGTFTTLIITSFGANWTNAGRTVADMGIVTTIDINGGTIDGTVIGGSSAAAGTFTTLGGTTITASVGFALGDGDYVGITSNEILTFAAAGTITVSGADFLIAAGNGLLIGHTAQLAVGGVTAEFEQFGTDAATATQALGMFNATAGTQAEFMFYRSKNAAIGSATVVASGDGLGKITWYGAQQTGTYATQNPAAQIRAEVDGTVTSGAGADMPGRIVFLTTPDGSGTLTEAMRLNASQQVVATIGFMPDANDGAYLGQSGTAFSDLFLADGGVINWNAGNSTITHSAGLLTSNVDIAVPDEAYGSGWNGSLEVPTKNAVYDKIETITPGWTIIKKSADETRQSSSTNTADSQLQFSMAASTTYVIRIWVIYVVANAAQDFKCILAGPASPTAVTGWSLCAPQNADGTVGSGGIVQDIYNTYASTAFSAVSADTGYGFAKYEVTVTNGANTGTFSFSWAQVSSGATDTTVKKGSYLEYYAI